MTEARRPKGAEGRPVCTRCAHYYVTWDPARPHGCKAYRFKSKLRPTMVVFESSGVRCQMFRKKK